MTSLPSKPSQADLYSKLPKEVLSVKDRINLRSVSYENKDQLKKFLGKNIPTQNKTEDLNYLVYSLQDTKPPIKQKLAKRKVDCLSAKERRKLFTITKNSKLNYSTFAKINTIWHGYIQSLLKDNLVGNELKLAKCDYHGAKLAVSASINPSLIGIVGIVVQETKNTFKLIDKNNKISGKIENDKQKFLC